MKILRTLCFAFSVYSVPAAVLAQDARYVSPVDGDTIYILLDGELERLRLKGIDTAETRGRTFCPGQRGGVRPREYQAGVAAAEWVERVLATTDVIEVVFAREADGTIERDGFDRPLGDLLIYGVSLSRELLTSGYARPWPRGERWWCK